MKPRCILFSLSAILLAISCGKTQEEEKPVVKPEIKVPAESQAIFSSGISFPEYTGTSAQESTLSFTATESWTTDVSDTKTSSWLSVRPSSGGAGTVNMTVSAQPNPGETERSAKVTIKCGTVTKTFSVTQAGNPPAVIVVESVTLDNAELALTEGEEATLVATVKPDKATDKTITWSTSNAEVATVDEGKVRALKEGAATITAKAGEKSADCTVTVKRKAIPVSSITLSPSTLELEEGQTDTLVVTILPEDADVKTVESLLISNSDVISLVDVDMNGVIVIMALKEGEAAITAYAGEKEATCEVKVRKKGYLSYLSVTPTSLDFLSSGGDKEIHVSAYGDWTVSEFPAWCTPSSTLGTGDATIVLTAVANSGAQRTGELTLTSYDKTATVKLAQFGRGWENQRFVHKSLYMMFTSVYCSYYSETMDAKIQRANRLVGNRYHRVDVYGSSLGESSINYPEAYRLENLFYASMPSGVVDNRIFLYNGSGVEEESFVDAILQQEKTYPAVTGVSFNSALTNGNLSVNGTVYAHEAESYKLTIYLLEDKVDCNSDSSLRFYNNVLRKSLTDTFGDSFDITSKNSTYDFQYQITIPDNYQKENLSVLVFVQRKYGSQEIIRTANFGEYYVDNCRIAPVGTTAVLQMYDQTTGDGNEGYDEGDEITF